MDDYYKACEERLRDATDPLGAIDELMALTLSDSPKIGICKCVEQAISLLSIVYQVTSCPTPELMARFGKIRVHINSVLDYMERTLATQAEFPSLPTPPTDAYWL